MFRKIVRKIKKFGTHTGNGNTFIQKTPEQIFCENGYKPWTSGYHEYKWRHIVETIDGNDFYSKLGTEKFGFRIDERAVEYPWLFSKLQEGTGLLLDAGSTLNFLPLIEHKKIQPKKLFISTLAPESQAFWQLGVSYVYEDFRETGFKNDFFDVVSCLSTIEHVGLDNTMYTCGKKEKENDTSSYLFFAETLFAKLKPGGKLYLSMPFGKQKNHGWFQVFDGAMLDALKERLNPAQYVEEIFYYSNDCWNLSNREEAKDATCFDIHVQKEYEPDFLSFSRSVACLEFEKPKN